MRNRWRRITGRRMARPLSGGPAGPGPRVRVLLGWAAAAALVALIAFVVGRPSRDAGTPELSPSAAATLPIVFGTALDAGSGEATEVTERFAAGDLFAYSVRLADPVGRDAVKVEVLRVDGDTLTVVQAPAAQAVSADSRVIAFSVPADALLSAFGEGEFLMRIYRDAGQTPVAEGHFRLIAAG
jgi:hypothetical protein